MAAIVTVLGYLKRGAEHASGAFSFGLSRTSDPEAKDWVARFSLRPEWFERGEMDRLLDEHVWVLMRGGVAMSIGPQLDG